MDLYLGIVKQYNNEKGFGFLTHPIYLGPKKNVFFHISKVNRSNIEIAKNLSNYNNGDEICFWYTSEITQKGEILQWILPPLDVFNYYQDSLPDVKEKIESIWKSTEVSVPFWLSEATIGLFGLDIIEELKSLREELIQKRREEKELQLKEGENLRKIWEEGEKIEQKKRNEERIRNEEEFAIAKSREEQQTKRQQEIKKQQENIENTEFELLVAEMKSMGFTKSAEVSNYIIEKRLGDKYQNISGILEMMNEHSSWKFNGGFPPKIYRKLCENLNLGNNETDSRVVGFTSFKSLNKNL
jgi:cold shock CspA family protein